MLHSVAVQLVVYFFVLLTMSCKNKEFNEMDVAVVVIPETPEVSSRATTFKIRPNLKAA